MSFRRLSRDKNGRWTAQETARDTVKVLLVLFVVYLALYALHSAQGQIMPKALGNVPNGRIEAQDAQKCVKADGTLYCYDKPETLKWVWEEEWKAKGNLGAVAPVVSPRPSKTFSVSAYTSRAEECDSSPEIAANGKNIWELYQKGVITCASNDYKFGTKLRIKGLGDCIVMDRMNRRYTGTGNVDYYFGKDLKKALAFGRRKLAVEVIN